MTSHTGTTMAAPAWGAFEEALPSRAGRPVGGAERAGEHGLRLRVRGRPAAALGVLLALWVALWGTFLHAVTPPAAATASRPQLASAAGSRP